MGEQSPDDESPPPTGKKPYVAPQLIELGKLRDITASVGSRRTADGRRFGNTRTSL